MAFYNNNNDRFGEAAMQQQSSPISVPSVEINAVMRMVYVWMGLGLLVTMATAYVVGNTPSLLELSIQPGMSIITIIAIFGTVIALSMGMNRNWLSPGMALGLFFLFAAVMGFSLASLMVAFLSETITLSSGETIVNTFYDPTPVYAAAGSAAALFGAMTFVGFTTKADLTKMGTYLFIGLIGIIIASVINIFIGSDGLSFIISILGVIIFTGLTAYDTQKIKEMSMNPQIANGGNLALKFSVMGALTLYLDLLNLFLFLLSIFGGRE
jgi:uncharacterized protein